MIAISYHIIMRDPLVAVVNSGPELMAAVQHTATLTGASAHLFVKATWHGPKILNDVVKAVAATGTAHPNVLLTMMAATKEDDALFQRNGVDSIWCNHNAFLDGRIYKPDLTAEKIYDAVYVARLVEWKRHHLAADVAGMAVVTKAYEVSAETAKMCLSTYRDLKYVNYDPEHGVTDVPSSEVAKVMTQSKCGLALSAEEGAMYSSGEYLLTGLPIVTTPSVGGRDVFFHPDYVEEVEETPDAVSAGVKRIIARDLDAHMIRNRTFQQFMAHRYRLIMRLSAIAQQDLFKQCGPNLWLPQFVNKLETYIHLKN